MKKAEGNLDRLLKARAEIDEQLRQHKSTVTVLFTDIVGSTSYFERFGDTAGLAMLHRNVELTREAVEQYQGTVIKTIGDSVMAEFPEPALAVHAAVEIQRRQWRQNENIPDQEQTHLRVGIHAGLGFRYANDLYGDVVNVAARVTKHTGPAQVLISASVREALKADSTLHCRSLGRITLEGRTEKEEVFEVLWTDTDTYSGLRERVHAAVQRGDLVSPGLQLGEMLARRTPTAHAPVLTPAGENLDPRFEVLEEISRGGMGIVYKARDRETGELLALKVLKPEIAADPTLMERFKNELRLARKITHKNVCRIYDFHRSNGAAYISMELVAGESLRAVLNRFGGLPLRKAVDLARQIAAALREAHSQGVVHRDLKPENVMVDPAGNVKVMDFGIALSMAMPASQTGTIVGTPAYMAPEQAEGRPVDTRADVYSLGLLLYEMLTSKPAFTGDTPVSIAMKQVREKPTPPRELEPAVPAAIEEIILRCLEKDPAERFQSVDEFEAALGKGAPRRGPAAGAAMLARAKALLAGRFSRRDWLAIASGLAVLLVAVLLVGRVFWPRQPSPADSPTVEETEAAPPTTADQKPAETTAPADAKSSQAEPSSPPPVSPAGQEPARSEPKRTPPAVQPGAQPPAPKPSRTLSQKTAAAPQENIFLLVQSFRSKEEAEALAAQLQESGFRTEIISKSRILWKSHDVRVGPYSSAERALAARNRLTELGYKDVRPVREGEE